MVCFLTRLDLLRKASGDKNSSSTIKLNKSLNRNSFATKESPSLAVWISIRLRFNSSFAWMYSSKLRPVSSYLLFARLKSTSVCRTDDVSSEISIVTLVDANRSVRLSLIPACLCDRWLLKPGDLGKEGTLFMPAWDLLYLKILDAM